MHAVTRYLSGNRFTRSNFVRNVALVMTGTAGAQALNMAFTPIITRLYGPEAFGVLGTFVAMLTIATPLAALNYPMAIVLPKRDMDAAALVKLSLFIALITSLVALILLFFFGHIIAKLFNLQSIEAYVLLMPLGMLLATTMALANEWVARKKLFKIKAQVTVMQALWLNLAKVGLGLFLPVAAVLIVLTVIANATYALMMYFKVKAVSQLPALSSIGQATKPLAAIAKNHSDFAYYRTPQIFLNGVSQSLPVLMLAAFFGPAAAGFYSLGRTILGIPSTLLGQSVSSVFYPRFNESVQAGENSYSLLLKATLSLAVLGIVPFGLIILMGPWLFTLAFGDQWGDAGQYARWLALWTFFAFVNRPCIAAIPVLALQGYFLAFETVGLLMRGAALLVGFLVFNDPLIAVALFSCVNVLLYLMLAIATIISAKLHRVQEAV
ncbi:lipopolysaccharide biosynthesis protein [Marinagarivorans cellulosilyticus]|uniref:Polysaccharide biosynthesis protein n=1 Tax=Marinagarivorans cellulosilyticus TaxID=2721545 RepID=A0AAN1WG80_9GAMM|nr:oligosaccharide flippase family protein [Marinagarivorans cellulosilyticus]BCD97017.1 hypothetical protein MARGE09_P1217 [Marinagarivorans cellulosilyticus]